MEDLKTCPFCGSVADVFRTDELGETERDRYTVRCGVCMCGTGYYADPARAQETWNHRVSED